jgi:hypothetical protein
MALPTGAWGSRPRPSRYSATRNRSHGVDRHASDVVCPSRRPRRRLAPGSRSRRRSDGPRQGVRRQEPRSAREAEDRRQGHRAGERRHLGRRPDRERRDPHRARRGDVAEQPELVPSHRHQRHGQVLLVRQRDEGLQVRRLPRPERPRQGRAAQADRRRRLQDEGGRARQARHDLGPAPRRRHPRLRPARGLRRRLLQRSLRRRCRGQQGRQGLQGRAAGHRGHLRPLRQRRRRPRRAV